MRLPATDHLRVALGAFIALLAGTMAPQAAARNRTAVTVSISREGDHLLLSYAFAAPQQALTLGAEERLPDGAEVSIVAGYANLEGNVIRFSTPMRRVQLRAAADSRVAAGAYPAVVQIGGGGFVIYLPAFTPNPENYSTRWRFITGAHDAAFRGDAAQDGFAYIGPAAGLSRHRSLTIISASANEARLAIVQERAIALLRFYSDRLGPLRRTPVLILPSDDARPAILAGEATPNGFIILPGWTGDLASFDHQLAHELFHLWNGHGFVAREDHNDHWLLEGGAEYAASVAVRTLWPEEDQLQSRLNAYLSPCRLSLGGEALGALDDQRAHSTAYSCGMLAHWSLDAGLRQASQGRRGVFDIWRSLFRRGAGRWDGAAFDRAIAHDGSATQAMLILRDAHGPTAWTQFASTLQRTGAGIERSGPSDDAFRQAVVLTILRAACGDNFSGYEEAQGELRLDVSDQCSAIPAGAQLVSVFGISPADGWPTIYARLAEACARRAPIEFIVRQNGHEQQVRAPCLAPLALREDWKVSSLF